MDGLYHKTAAGEIKSAEMMLSQLREQIQKACSLSLSTPKDFDKLEASIFEKTHEMVNASTLKRLFGYIGDVRCPRESTLDILCRYIGYADWKTFVSKQEGGKEVESSLVMSDYLYSDEMFKGETLRILWQPDRELVIECNGNEKFTVRQAVNTKLQVGNTFRCPLFIQHEPLYLTEVTGLTSTPSSFVCGSVNGVTFM